MANVLPIALLAGGALLLAGGKKKRRRKKAAPAYEVQSVPPTKAPAEAAKTSGPSGKAAGPEIWNGRQIALAFVAGMKVCNSHPGAVDGVYGPATLNAIIAFQMCVGINVTGKWDEQTDAAMKKMLLDISRGQVKVLKVGPRDVFVSADFQRLKIGSSWKIAVLDEFLEKRRKSGKLITDPKGIKFMDVVLHDPSEFLGELVGLEGETAQNIGYAIYGTLWLIATAGLVAEAAALVPYAMAWSEVLVLFTLEELIMVGGIVGAEAVIGTTYTLWQDNVMATTALGSIAAFMKSHYVIVGSKKVRIDKLPFEEPATQQLNKAILDYVYAFQVRTYED